MFWTSQKNNPRIKQGFLVPRDGGDMRAAELYCYDHGVYIVKSLGDNFEAQFVNVKDFQVSSYTWPRFIVTEVE